MVTKLCSRQEIIQKRNAVELQLLCTALRDIARSMHTKLGVIWINGDKVMLRTRNPAAATTDAATADQSNPYMLPGQVTQK